MDNRVGPRGLTPNASIRPETRGRRGASGQKALQSRLELLSVLRALEGV
jgi:hypothetical protein